MTGQVMTSRPGGRICWVTDIHLNFLRSAQVETFFSAIASRQPDVVAVTGDIAEAGSVEDFLLRLAAAVPRPIFFVLGNHDFYGASIGWVRDRMEALSRTHPQLRWLNDAGIMPLTESSAVVGHDGWADGRLGRGRASLVLLNDFFHISDLTGLSVSDRFDRLAELGDEAALHFRRILPTAFETYTHVLLLTHVPPFREACWHEGQLSDDDYLPLFASRAAGEALLEIMKERPDRDLTVLCGHSHSEGRAQMLPNLRVLTGHADYGAPELQPEVVMP
jgi:Icc protein